MNDAAPQNPDAVHAMDLADVSLDELMNDSGDLDELANKVAEDARHINVTVQAYMNS